MTPIGGSIVCIHCTIIGGMCQVNRQILLENLGNNIRKYRLDKCISQEELAFRINSARNFIGCIERAEKAPTIVTLARIANALNISLSELVKNIDKYEI